MSTSTANGILRVRLSGMLLKGKSKAITSRELAYELDTDERAVRLAIRDMIADGIPIASSTQKPMGFFIAESPEEADQYMASLKSRLVEDAYRRRDFKRASRDLWPEKQLNLL